MIQKSMINRKTENLTGNISYDENKVNSNDYLILCSPSDIGVRRNLGRNGARFAPKSILSYLQKLNKHGDKNTFTAIEVTDQITEKNNFQLAQAQSAKKIHSLIKSHNNPITIHIGGGHDHIYPLLKAIKETNQYKNIVILNIDAHCDTRTDEIPHSGTPFRNFDNEAPSHCSLFQYGINYYSNSVSTLTKLENIKDEKYFYAELIQETESFTKIPQSLINNIEVLVTKETALIFSLDCDAICGHEMQAVSAINPTGIPLLHIKQLLQKILHLNAASTFIGIYELNPVFDNISGLAAKKISTLLYECLIQE